MIPMDYQLDFLFSTTAKELVMERILVNLSAGFIGIHISKAFCSA